jgi:hypothetical protein
MSVIMFIISIAFSVIGLVTLIRASERPYNTRSMTYIGAILFIALVTFISAVVWAVV